jgi:drug/metabolite transporter (DMT)-like permease
VGKKLLWHGSMFTASFALAFIGVFVKLIGNTVPSITLAFFRSSLGFMFLFCIVPLMDKNVFKNFKRNAKSYAITGLLMAAGFTAAISALNNAPISNVIMMLATNVIFVALFASHFLHEKITKREKLAMLVGIVGVAVINPFKGGYALGNSLALLAAAIGATLIVYMRYEGKNHTAGSSMWFLFFAAIFLAPAPFIWGFGDVMGNWFWLLLLGILCTGLAYFLFNFGIEHIKAEDASLLMMISQPVFAISLAYFLIGEVPSHNILWGGAILLLAGFILESGKKFCPSHILKKI